MSTIIENLQVAHEIIREAPPENVELSYFGRRTTCGTLYCALGWLAASGRFKEHFKLDWYTRPGEAETFATLVKPAGGLLSLAVLGRLFGEGAFSTLFTWRRAGELDKAWSYLNTGGSDQDLSLWRIEQHIVTQRILELQEVQDLLEMGNKLRTNPDDTFSRALLDVRTKDGVIHRTLRVQLWCHGDRAYTDLKEMGERAAVALVAAGYTAALNTVENRLSRNMRMWITIS